MKSTIAEMIGYISLEDWCEFEGTTPTAINIRISRGHWQRGLHVVKPKGGRSMVCIQAAKKWLEQERSQKG